MWVPAPMPTRLSRPIDISACTSPGRHKTIARRVQPQTCWRPLRPQFTGDSNRRRSQPQEIPTAGDSNRRRFQPQEIPTAQRALTATGPAGDRPAGGAVPAAGRREREHDRGPPAADRRAAAGTGPCEKYGLASSTIAPITSGCVGCLCRAGGEQEISPPRGAPMSAFWRRVRILSGQTAT